MSDILRNRPNFDERRGKDEAASIPLVYLVDDDDDFREEMVFGLASLGFGTHGFESAAALYRAYAAKPADIVILDVGLKGENGLSAAAHLRSSQSVGIIMVTARGSIDDRINGLESGADAYLVKPVDIRELAATVMAVYNRLERSVAVTSPCLSPEWVLVESGWVITDGRGHRLRLTTSEQRILSRLLDERGAIVKRHDLIVALGEDIYEFNYAHLDTIVSRLRRRAKNAGIVLPLHAIRGKGFTFAD
ncbi:response regulator transcription factor [Brucella anthropi]|uniref:response regulator transcription factor n=1 Tax=Brucella anthropi TaxID=529 RepID=UPI00125DBECC|nr:response regulator transcription factor [Brucella anthropi]QFP64591.1 response regulator transcription factor [Brucella anthropi]